MKKLTLTAVVFLAMAGTPLMAQTPAAPLPAVTITGPTLRVMDIERSVKFYTENFGLVISRKEPHGTEKLAVLGAQDTKGPPLLILIETSPSPPMEQGNGFSKLMMNAPDSIPIYNRLKAAGFAPSGAGMGGTIQVKDPDGYLVEVVAPKPAK